MDLVTLLALAVLANGGGLADLSRAWPRTESGMAVLAQSRRAVEGTPPDTVSAGEVEGRSAIDRWQPYIADAARRFGIPEPWIRAVMRAESGGETSLGGRPITSPAGAMCLMQIMPETYAEVSMREGLGSDPYDPWDNILAGAAYLREMYDRFGYPGLFAAYNAGPDRFEAYLRGEAPLPDETWRYLATISQAVAEAIALEQGPASWGPVAPTIHLQNPSGAGLFFALSPVTGGFLNAMRQKSDNPAPIMDSSRKRNRSGALLVPLGLPSGSPAAL